MMGKRGRPSTKIARRGILATLGAAGAGLLAFRASSSQEADAGSANAAQVAQGQVRLTYTLNAAEVWVADFGTGRLEGGRARIDLPGDYLSVVNTEVVYRVLITPTGRTPGLFVSQRDPRGFTVEEQAGGSGTVGFDYQVVAKQRGQENKRLDTYIVPTPIPTTPPPPPAAPLPDPPKP